MEASGNRALQLLYEPLPWDDLDLFYDKVNLACLCIRIEVRGNMLFNGRKLAGYEQMDRFMFMKKKNNPSGVVCKVYLYTSKISDAWGPMLILL